MRKPPSDRYIRFYGPILEVLRELGGAASPKEVKAAVLDRVAIPELERSRTLKSGQNAVENEVAWARDGLRRSGLIDGSVQGVWRLTPEGASANFTIDQFRALRNGAFAGVSAGNGTDVKGPRSQVVDEPDAPDSGGDLLAAIYGLTPAGFEQLCKRVLHESGFYDVQVTKQGADGGIDGKGILQLNELVSFRVLFQCKRYKDTVGVDVIRNFQAALHGRADRGIILTTAVFTREAEKEASREGGMYVELVDGQRLVRLMERLKLGVLPRTVYDVDHKFFESFERTAKP